MFEKKVTFREDAELISDNEVKEVVKSYVTSTMTKLYKFFISKPYIDMSEKIINIKIILKARPNIVFYNILRKTKEEIINKVEYSSNKYFIGLKSQYINTNIFTPLCLELALQSNPLKSNFQTEINGFLITGKIVLYKENLTQTEYGTVETEEDQTVLTKRINNTYFEKLYEDYANTKLNEAIAYENKLGKKGVKVYLNKKEYRLSCNKKGITSSYPRLLLERKLGRTLNKDEECGHIDGNPLNNDIGNLRVLLGLENSRISSTDNKRKMTEKQKENMRIAKIGYRPNQETIDKMREVRSELHKRNLIYTPEVRAKMSKSISDKLKMKMLNNEVSPGKGKLTLSQVTNYRKLYENGEISKKQIILETGVNESTVSRFLTYATFKV